MGLKRPETNRDVPSAEEMSSVLAELLRMLASHTLFRALLVTIAMVVICVFVNASPVINDGIWQGWLAVGVTMQVVRWALMRRLPSLSTLTESAKVTMAAGVLGINGLLIGMACLAFPYIDAYSKAIIGIIVIGSSSVVVSSTFGYRRTAAAYVIPALVPVFLMWGLNPVHLDGGWLNLVLRPNGIDTIVSIVGFGYTAVLIISGNESFRRFQESVITQKKLDRVNRQLEEAVKQAELASAAKTRFLASASHDLRQPIHTLSLFGAALNLQKLDEKSRQIATHMSTSLEVLSSQLDRLLDISKLDAGIVAVHARQVDLASVLERLRQEFELRAEAQGIVFSCAVRPGYVVETDVTLLELILRNLIENAFKYTERGSVVVGVERRQERFEIYVVDTGCGVAPAEQEKIFEEFYQVGNPHRDRAKGLGLGLAIVRRLTTLLGVQLDLVSSPGVGSRFSLFVPVLAVPLPVTVAPVAAESQPRAADTLRVLVLDDEVEIRAGMKMLLESLGWQVQVAADVEEALTLARGVRPDVLLVDFRLAHGVDGIDAIHRLRAAVGPLPALLISGDTAPQRLREAQAAGIPLFTKPVPAEVLEAAIREAHREGSVHGNDREWSREQIVH